MAQTHADARLVRFVPPGVLRKRERELRDLIARRAYEIFRQRDSGAGNQADDWAQAESEILDPCGDETKETDTCLILEAYLGKPFQADEIEIAVEPRCVILSGERDVTVTCDRGGRHEERRKQRIFRIEELPVEVRPDSATAMLKGETLEVVLPKAGLSARAGARL